MRMAERPGEPGSTLLMHEFFEVIVQGDGRAEEAQVYQALGFAENGDVIMVKGLYYAPARVVLGYRPLRGNAHTYDAACTCFIGRRHPATGGRTGASSCPQLYGLVRNGRTDRRKADGGAPT
jgi:hypothetical protein